jgi:hypothetical protein
MGITSWLKKIVAGSALILTVAACATASPIPQGTVAPAPAASPTTAAVVSTCDAVREAFLTGTPAQVLASLTALKADRTADGTAREYADYYMDRDKNQADLQKMDRTLITASCG